MRLPWSINCVCVRARACVCAFVCVRARVSVRERLRYHMSHMCACGCVGGADMVHGCGCESGQNENSD